MSDLTEYDREIVARAEEWADRRNGPSETMLHRAVQAKKAALRPPCNETVDTPSVFCGRPAVQELNDHGGTFHRCDEHRIEVREL